MAGSKPGRLASHPWIAALGKLRRWPHFTWTQRFALMEAFCAFWFARLLLAVLPFRTLAARLGATSPSSKNEPLSLSEREEKQVRRIGWSVSRIGSHTPLDGTCLPQALAASWMLRRRGLPGTLHLGVRLQAPASSLEAHAWLRSGDVALTGFPVDPGFQEIGCITLRHRQ